jgi:hypothetical protein
MSGDDAKPPPIARDEHDRERIETWLNKKLNEALDIADKQFAEDVKHFNEAAKDAAFRQSLRARLDENRAWLRSDHYVIEAAKRGDLKPAQAKHPALAQADMLKLPAQPGPGKRFQESLLALSSYERDLTEAVWDAAEMRAILKQEYKPRPKGYYTPEQMAARRHGVQEEHVRAWQKNRRCPKRPS